RERHQDDACQQQVLSPGDFRKNHMPCYPQTDCFLISVLHRKCYARTSGSDGGSRLLPAVDIVPGSVATSRFHFCSCCVFLPGNCAVVAHPHQCSCADQTSVLAILVYEKSE